MRPSPREGAASAQTKLDPMAELKQLYSPPSREGVIVDVPEMRFLMIDGAGNPNTAQDYRDAVETLYSVSYTLKFMAKKERGIDYRVMPLEGLWWAEDMAKFSLDDKASWQWTAMIRQPDFITQDHLDRAREQAVGKKPLPALVHLRLASFREGLAAQIMYVGPYAAEGPTIARLHEFIRDQGHVLSGKHHEIYLGDPRRSAPQNLKTVIRQPIRDA